MHKKDLWDIILDPEEENLDESDEPRLRFESEGSVNALRTLRRALETYAPGSSSSAAEVYLAIAHELTGRDESDEPKELIASKHPSYLNEVLSILARAADPLILMKGNVNALERHMDVDSWSTTLAQAMIERIQERYPAEALCAAVKRGLSKEAQALLDRGAETTGVLEAALNAPEPQVDLAENILARGAHFSDPHIITKIVSAGSAKLLSAWMEQYRTSDEAESLLTEALYVAASQKKGDYVDQLVKAGAKPLLAKHGRKIVSMLAREHRNDALWYMLDHGVVFDKNHPMSNLRAIKCAALDMPISEKSEKLFDAMVAPLRNEKTLHGTIPYFEGFEPADVVEQSEQYRDFVAFSKVVGIAHRIATQLGAAHPEALSPVFTSLMAHCLHPKQNKSKFSWGREVKSGSLKNYHPEEAKDVGDCLRYMTKVLLMPALLRRVQDPDKVDLHKAVEILLSKLAPHIIGERSMPTVLDLAARFSHAHVHLGALRLAPRQAEWPPLTDDWKDRSGYRVTFLTTPKQLGDEGDMQHHCVSTMDDACLYSNSHVASVRKNNPETGREEVVATALLSLDNHNRLRLLDHRLVNNVRVEAGSLAAGIMERFMLAFQLGEAKLNPKVQPFARRAASIRGGRGEDYVAWLGFDPKEDPPRTKEIQTWVSDQEVHREWKTIDENAFMQTLLEHVRTSDQSIIPGGRRKWGDKQVNDFLQETGLMAEIEALAADPPCRGGHGRAQGPRPTT